jgi:glyceraldehyde 3-phosphate dehydrogenase
LNARKPKIAINGFGRIGRAVLRILAKRDDLEVVAINDITPTPTLAYLLKYDTVHGRFDGEVRLDGDTLVAAGLRPKMIQERDPSNLPWKAMGVDLVIEATGRFRKADEIKRHLDAGAGKVILTVPAKDTIDFTCVLGVNGDDLRAEHRIVSNASCTTNCLAPVAKVLHESFGIRRGYITTVHAYTNDQRLNDYVHNDLRRSRAAAENIIPTTTGAARAVGKVLPELEGKLDGIAMRVPVPDGSIVDLVVELDEDPNVDEINAAMAEAASSGGLQGILQYSDEPLVSTDIIGNPYSAIFDAPSTRSRGARMAKIIAWYDNEWGYSCRVVDLAEKMVALG